MRLPALRKVSTPMRKEPRSAPRHAFRKRTMNKQDRPAARTLLPGTRHARPPRAGQLFDPGHGLDRVPDQPSGPGEHPADATGIFAPRAGGLGRVERRVGQGRE